jgi:hypothetical protein
MKTLSIIGICFSSFLIVIFLANLGSLDRSVLQGSIVWGILGCLYLLALSIMGLIEYGKGKR